MNATQSSESDPRIKLLTAAEEQFLRYGIRSVSMDDLARKLGISKKTIYQYVESKADLIQQMCWLHTQRDIETLQEITSRETDPVEEMFLISEFSKEELGRMTPTVIHDLNKYYPDLWKTLERHHRTFFRQFIIENLNRGKAEGYYRADLSVDIISRLFVGVTLSLVDEEVFSWEEHHPSDVIETHLLYHLRGVCTSKGIERMQVLLEPQP